MAKAGGNSTSSDEKLSERHWRAIEETLPAAANLAFVRAELERIKRDTLSSEELVRHFEERARLNEILARESPCNRRRASSVEAGCTMEPRAGQASYPVDRRAAKIPEAGCDSFAVADAGRRRSEGVHTWGSRHLFKGGIIGGLWSGPKWRGSQSRYQKIPEKEFQYRSPIRHWHHVGQGPALRCAWQLGRR